jgi:phosphate transport system permease protein
MKNSPSTISSNKIRLIKVKEGGFKFLMMNSALLTILLLAAIFITLIIGSLPSIKASGFYFLSGTNWDPISNKFGSLPFLTGTLITSFLALLISFPFSIALALLLGEFYKKGIVADVFKNIIELMAGVPSVIYGFAALYFLTPRIAELAAKFGYPAIGVNMLSAAIVLAIMIVPYWTSVAREVISLTPNDIREAAFSLGATRFEVIRHTILPYTKTGIIAGMLLALGRALGETMAVTMVIGNASELHTNIFSPSNTMASVIANSFNEASSKVHTSALIEIALLLFIVSAVLNLLGKSVIKNLASK